MLLLAILSKIDQIALFFNLTCAATYGWRAAF
jgi:hypothetical protein